MASLVAMLLVLLVFGVGKSAAFCGRMASFALHKPSVTSCSSPPTRHCFALRPKSNGTVPPQKNKQVTPALQDQWQMAAAFFLLIGFIWFGLGKTAISFRGSEELLGNWTSLAVLYGVLAANLVAIQTFNTMKQQRKESRDNRREDQKRSCDNRREDQAREDGFRREDQVAALRREIRALRRENRELKSENPFRHFFNADSWMEIEELEHEIEELENKMLWLKKQHLLIELLELESLASEAAESERKEFKVHVPALEGLVSEANKKDIPHLMLEAADLRAAISKSICDSILT